MTNPVQTVTDFLAEWSKSPEEMHASYRTYFTDATIWENVGLSTTTGIDEALTLLGGFEANYGVDVVKVDMLAIAAAGNKVLTERIDRLMARDGSEVAALRLMGIFEVEGGKIVRWRDYFDSAAMGQPASA